MRCELCFERHLLFGTAMFLKLTVAMLQTKTGNSAKMIPIFVTAISHFNQMKRVVENVIGKSSFLSGKSVRCPIKKGVAEEMKHSSDIGVIDNFGRYYIRGN